MRDFRLSEITQIRPPKASVNCSSILQPAVKAFGANMHRANALVLMTPYAVTAAVAMAESQLLGCLKLLQRPFPTPEEQADSDFQSRLLAASVDALREEIIPPQYQDPIEQTVWFFSKGIGVLDYFSKVMPQNSYIPQGMQAILESALLTAFTAFEVLVEDLLVAALNASRRLVIAYAKTDGKNQEKSFRVSEIVGAMDELGSDFSKRFGDLLCLYEKIDLRSLGSTGAVYKKVFGNQADSIFGSPELRLFELVRNVFAHVGGIVDNRFIEKRNKISGLADDDIFRKLSPDDRIELDGADVRRFTSAAIEAGEALIQLVDSTLSGAGETNRGRK